MTDTFIAVVPQKFTTRLRRMKLAVWILSVVCAVLVTGGVYVWSLKQEAIQNQRATAAAAAQMALELEEVREVAERLAIALGVEEETTPSGE